MFELPLIRVDQKEYLVRLQEGEFFMRSSLYYQMLDGDDTARSDPFDGSIPASDFKSFPFSQFGISDISNSRIILGHTFIKSFFYCDKTDYRRIQEGIYLLSLSTAARKALEDFSAPYALIIFSPSQFVEQVSSVCERQKLKLWYDEVEYLTDEQLHERKIALLTGSSRKNPCFYKSTAFQNQQEFRFCVQVPYKHISGPKVSHDIEYFIIDFKAKEETYKLNIGSLKNISCILPVPEILNYPVVVDTNNKKVSFLREVGYEEFERQRD